MDVFLNRVDGIDDAILSMFFSKRTVDRELEMKVRNEVNACTKLTYWCDGPVPYLLGGLTEVSYELQDWLEKLFKWGEQHYTMLRFIDLSFTVYNLHRGGQDDLDAHSMRMNNRIIRSSTRLGRFEQGEMSDWYKGRIVPTDVALAILGITMPEELEVDGKVYVRSTNGYILKEMADSNDARRGLYMLSIPSSFIFRIQLTEFAHVYKERRLGGAAHPELQLAVEDMAMQVEAATHKFANRELFMRIRN